MTAPLVCQTITASTMAELLEKREAAQDVDLVELRLDGVKEPDVREALAGRRLPAIVTCRPAWEGGRFAGSEEERHRLLREAADAGAEYIDIEFDANFRDLIAHRRGRGIVLSMHDFTGIPADLASRYRAMRQTGAEIVKIAVTARRLSDVFVFEPFAGSPTVRGSDGPKIGAPSESRTLGPSDSVFIAMGPSGVATRILPGRFGSCWTYAGSEAPGQMTAEELLCGFRARAITASTAIYGVVGARASRSLSPSLHNAAFATANLDAVYLPFETNDYDDFLAFADRLPVAGASVTIPFKEVATARASEVDDMARLVGAVNTLRRAGNGWQATNTDVAGFLEPIGDVALQGMRAAILGAGGAARAVAVAVRSRGALVSVFARNAERAREVASLAKGDASTGLPEPGSWDLLVNATPVGSWPGIDQSPIGAGRLRGGTIVYDLVYDPPETRLLREARAAGCRTVGGLAMLMAQARCQREWWAQKAQGSGLRG